MKGIHVYEYFNFRIEQNEFLNQVEYLLEIRKKKKSEIVSFFFVCVLMCLSTIATELLSFEHRKDPVLIFNLLVLSNKQNK